MKVNDWLTGTRDQVEQTFFNSSIKDEGVPCARGDKEYAQIRWTNVGYRHSGGAWIWFGVSGERISGAARGQPGAGE